MKGNTFTFLHIERPMWLLYWCARNQLVSIWSIRVEFGPSMGYELSFGRSHTKACRLGAENTCHLLYYHITSYYITAKYYHIPLSYYIITSYYHIRLSYHKLCITLRKVIQWLHRHYHIILIANEIPV